MFMNKHCHYIVNFVDKFSVAIQRNTNAPKRKQRFVAKYVQSDNVLCQLFAHVESV